jgi:hypothetical protein
MHVVRGHTGIQDSRFNIQIQYRAGKDIIEPGDTEDTDDAMKK